MARAALANIPTADIAAEMNRRARQADKLSAKRDALADELDALDAELAELDSVYVGATPKRIPGRKKKATSAKGARRAGGGKRPKNSMSLVEAMQKVMKGKDLQINEIMSGVKKAGYKTSSPNFRTIVSQALGREKKLFKRVSRGIYTAK